MTEIYSEQIWQEKQAAHEARAEDRLQRFRHPGSYHPVHDFLFSYYPVRPSHLRKWHPGIGVALEGNPPHEQWRDYTRTNDGVTVDLDTLWPRRGDSFLYIRKLLANTRQRPAQFDCFGLHEWAMCYKTDQPRHDLPLRLGAEGTNEVVETHKIRCSHYDAFRFFTPPARPLNLRVLTREDQPDTEQAGCVHATMDLYKWAWKLGPLVPGDVFLDCLDLAIDARTLDMEASPYDCRDWGYGVVAIETPEGKAEYVRRQRELSERGDPLRQRLVGLIDAADPATIKR
ncbi:3-methyladenine DNA glycosylase [Corynebacterium camporealensis]